MTIALIDADIIAYQAAVTAQKVIDWGDGIWTLQADEGEAERSFDGMVAKIAEAVGATEITLAVTEGANWRTDILPTYKLNRDPTKKPMLLSHLRARAVSQGAFLRTPLEGDDCLGILQTMKKNVGKTIICSLDKDFKTIPGRHYNFKTGEFYEVTEAEADYYHMLQTLMGDTTDGYIGCPGIGMETAKELLDNPVIFYQEDRVLKSGPRKGEVEKQWKKRPLEEGETIWDMVVSCFKKAGLGEEEALRQARVARICRSSDYDFTTKQVILWNPKKN